MTVSENEILKTSARYFKSWHMQLASVKGVLFDYGRTLINTRTNEQTLRELLRSRGYAFSMADLSKALTAFGAHWDTNYSKLPRGSRWSESIRLDCDKATIKSLGLTDKGDELAAHVAQDWSIFSGVELYQDVRPTLNALARLGLKMGVVSQNLDHSSKLRVELQTLGIGPYFQLVLTSEDAGYDKPDPTLYLHASDLIGLKPSHLCHVGNDYELDVIGARKAGITPILIDREGQAKQKDCLAIRSLQEIPSLLPHL